MDVCVNHKVRWPHDFVLVGQNKDRVTYNQLSPVQWMAGFVETSGRSQMSDVKNREHLLHYVIDLLDDAREIKRWLETKENMPDPYTKTEHL